MCKFINIPVNSIVKLSVTGCHCANCKRSFDSVADAYYRGHQQSEDPRYPVYGDYFEYLEATTCHFCGYRLVGYLEPCEDFVVDLSGLVEQAVLKMNREV